VDLNSIPTAAVERIEILKDGGSAVYGSDAIAGVVNIITRKVTTASSSAATPVHRRHGDANVYDFNVLAGAQADPRQLHVRRSYFKQKEFFAPARDWATNAAQLDFHDRGGRPGGSGTLPRCASNSLDPSACDPAKPACAGLLATLGGQEELHLRPDPLKAGGRTAPRGGAFATRPVDFFNYRRQSWSTPSQAESALRERPVPHRGLRANLLPGDVRPSGHRVSWLLRSRSVTTGKP